MIGVAITLTVYSAVVTTAYLLAGVAMWATLRYMGLHHSTRMIFIWPGVLIAVIAGIIWVQSIMRANYHVKNQ